MTYGGRPLHPAGFVVSYRQILVPQFGVLENVAGRAVEGDLTHVQDEGAVREFQRRHCVLFDNDGSDAEFLDLADDALDFLHDDRRQPFGSAMRASWRFSSTVSPGMMRRSSWTS